MHVCRRLAHLRFQQQQGAIARPAARARIRQCPLVHYVGDAIGRSPRLKARCRFAAPKHARPQSKI